MKYALIAPPNALYLLDRFRLSYHMVLVQYLDDPVYREWYRAAAKRGDFIILDNGAAEAGTPMDPHYLVAAANDLGATEVVMPDVLGNHAVTLDLTEAARYLIPKKARMCIPQGETWEKWTFCLKQMVMWGCASIGVAKVYEGFVGGRTKALEIIRQEGYHLTHNVHLFGCYTAPVDEAHHVAQHYPWVRGIDTAAPIAYAQQNTSVELREHMSLDWNVPFNMPWAIANIKSMLLACNEEY